MSDWENVGKQYSKKYFCGHCSYRVSSNLGYQHSGNLDIIFICPECSRPTYFDPKPNKVIQIPGVVPGNSVNHVPDDIYDLYNESRKCISISAFTSSVLSSRKILMNIAVNEGAKPGLTFFDYVEYLDNNGFLPPKGKSWVDHIRKKGNEATHEIASMSESDAKDLTTFIEMILKFIYEFPGNLPNSSPTP